MMLNTIKLFLLILLIFSFYSCEKEVSVSPPDPEVHRAMLFVDSKPQGAYIYINGKNTGQKTPDTIKWLEPKQHALKLKAPLYKDTNVVVGVEESSVKSVFLDFTTNPNMFGSILVNSDPYNSLVFINDSSTGKRTPVTLSGIVPGTYKFTFKSPGFWDKSVMVDIISGRTTRTDVMLTDSVNWVVYTSERTGAPIDYITHITGEGHIKWISTLSEGLIKFDDKEWVVYNSNNSPLTTNYIKSTAIAPNGEKWLSTNDGVFVFDETNWRNYNTSNSGIASNDVNCVAFGPAGKIYFGTNNNGLSIFDGSGWTTVNTTTSAIHSNHITSIDFGKNDTVWVATMDGGLVKFKDFKHMTVFKKYPIGGPPGAPFSNNNVTTIKIDNKYNLRAAFGVHLTSDDKDGGSAVYNGVYWIVDHSTPPSPVTQLQIAPDGAVWYTTVDNGIYKQTGSNSWKSFTTSTYPMGNNSFYSVYIDENNIKYFGSNGSGLVKYKGN